MKRLRLTTLKLPKQKLPRPLPNRISMNHPLRPMLHLSKSTMKNLLKFTTNQLNPQLITSDGSFDDNQYFYKLST
jgi:hypothetical protein